MNRFNLTFSGEIVTGQKPETVKLRFGKMFAIDDPVKLELFFSGEPVILRRNLERKEAAQYFQDMRKIGAVSELVKVTASEAANATARQPAPSPDPATSDSSSNKETNVNAGKKSGGPGRSKSRNAKSGSSGDKAKKAVKDAARKKARMGKAKRQAAAEAKREQARVKAEADARQKPLWEESEREEQEHLKAEEAARLKAQQEEQQRHKTEEAARLQVERQELERLKAEKAARLQAELEELQRLKAEETARLQAESEEQQRREAEEAARLQAEQEEREKQERLEAEEAARMKAELEELQRRKAEEAARLQAEQEEREKQERLQAEEAARMKAELEELQRREAEEAARLQAELDEIQREEEDQAAKLQAELAEKERQSAVEAVRIKADAEYKRAEAQRKSLERRGAAPEPETPAALHQQRQQEQELQQPTTQTATRIEKAEEELSSPLSLKPAKARVKTSIEVPQRLSGQAAATEIRRKRQPGEPNLYQLQAFRNTPEVRSRAARARQRQRQGFTLGALALAGLLVLTGAFLRHPPSPALAGASAIAIDLQHSPVMLAGDWLLFHDRSGVGTRQVALGELGLVHLRGPMAFDSGGDLIALGQQLATAEAPAAVAAPVLMRCQLALSRCLPFAAELANIRIDTFAINTIDNTLLLADTAGKQLLKVDAQGKVLLRKDVAMPERPVLRLNSGLLFMNSALGPAISVFRYDDNAFGQQLDEVLLLPPAATELEQTSAGDFVWSADAWWVNLINPQNGSMGLYRFDKEWNFLEQVETPFKEGTLELSSWVMKTLANDGRSVEIQRFNAQGKAEVPLVSSLLKELVDGQQRRARVTALSWRGALLLCALVTALGLFYGYLQSLRTLVYKSHRERGAQPVDDYEDTLQWIDPLANRISLLRRRGVSYTLLATALILLAIGSSVSALQLTALLIALSGPAIALLLWRRRPLGNIGRLDQSLLLVDHRGMYHMGEGSQIHYRGSFLLLDDVLVFTGNRLLPAFSREQVQKDVGPLVAGGVKVDRNTVMVKLLQSQHPLALGAIAIMGTATVAVLLLGLKGIF